LPEDLHGPFADLAEVREDIASVMGEVPPRYIDLTSSRADDDDVTERAAW
jgi:hypothetical protein